MAGFREDQIMQKLVEHTHTLLLDGNPHAALQVIILMHEVSYIFNACQSFVDTARGLGAGFLGGAQAAQTSMHVRLSACPPDERESGRTDYQYQCPQHLTHQLVK